MPNTIKKLKRIFKSAVKNNRGFTYVELLAVAAIIGIIVAVSSPFIRDMPEKARIAADTANERAAALKFLTDKKNGDIKINMENDNVTTFYYDAKTGKFVAANLNPANGALISATDVTASPQAIDAYGQTEASTLHKGGVLMFYVIIKDNIPTTYASWVELSSSGAPTKLDGLCTLVDNKGVMPNGISYNAGTEFLPTGSP